MVRQLGPVTPAAELAGQLNAAGLTTGNGRPFDVKAVQWIRHAYHIPAPAPYADGEISVAEAARQLGCSTGVIYYWIQTGQLDARRGPGNRLCIPWNDRIQAACRERIAASGHLNPACPAHQAPPPTLSRRNVGTTCHAHASRSEHGLTSQSQPGTFLHTAAGGAV